MTSGGCLPRRRPGTSSPVSAHGRGPFRSGFRHPDVPRLLRTIPGWTLHRCDRPPGPFVRSAPDPSPRSVRPLGRSIPLAFPLVSAGHPGATVHSGERAVQLQVGTSPVGYDGRGAHLAGAGEWAGPIGVIVTRDSDQARTADRPLAVRDFAPGLKSRARRRTTSRRRERIDPSNGPRACVSLRRKGPLGHRTPGPARRLQVLGGQLLPATGRREVPVGQGGQKPDRTRRPPGRSRPASTGKRRGR